MGTLTPLILVDGSGFLYRAYHALPPLTNVRGEPTGAVYGVANMLKRLVTDYAPERIAVVFDAKGPTFRDALYAGYKAQRPPMPDDLAAQIEPLKALVRALGLPLVEVSGVEADDVIGTLTTQARARGWPVLIATGDKDIAQLVTDEVTLLDTMKNTRLDPAGVAARFGVPPERIVDYLALVGDTSDNIPGVRGVGPKTAAKWLGEYGTLDALIENAAAVGGKIGEALREALPQLPLTRMLATIKCDVELPVTLDALAPQAPDAAALRPLLERFGFKQWLTQIGTGAAPAASSPTPAPAHSLPGTFTAPRTVTVLDLATLDDWLARLASAELISFDTETTSLDYLEARIVGVSFCVAPEEAAYVPLAHCYAGAPDQLDRDTVLARLKPLLEDPQCAKLGHHLKYDAHVLANHGITLAGIAHDSMLESYVLDAAAQRHDMDTLAEKYLQHRTIHYEDVAGKGAKQIGFEQVAIEQAAPYAAEDVAVTLALHRHFWPQLQATPELRALYETLEMPLLSVIGRMERNGVCVDVAMLRRQSAELGARLIEYERSAHAAADGPFNLGSPKQIQEVLYQRLGLPVLARTPGGAPSTDEDALTELAAQHPLPQIILDYRALAKLKSTYTERLPEQVNARTGRVHTSYHQAVAATGRLSSSDPNLQNIPVRSEEGRRIRRAFVAPAGMRLIAADYSQIELRLMAHLSGDAMLLAAFARGDDVHRATAAEVFGVSVAAVSDEQRRAAKAINFGLMYGMSAFGLARQLGIERGAAQQYVELYFSRYPGVRAYMDGARAQARERGYVETLFGRRLYIPEIQARNSARRQYAERTAINAPLQGSAADIIKRAMLALDGWIAASGLPVKMIMQVHDELVFECAESTVPEAIEAIRVRMMGAAELRVPLIVDVGVGADWDEAH
jgi:DNA polymerase-1